MAVEDKLAIFKRLSQKPMLKLKFWNETDLNMNLKSKSSITASWVPRGAGVGLHVHHP